MATFIVLMMMLAQRPAEPTLAERARAARGDFEISEIYCFFGRDLKSLLSAAPFVFEGRVAEAETKLTSDQTSLYTEYIFDIIQVLHPPGRETASYAQPLPYLPAPPQARPALISAHRVRLTAPVGRLTLEGITITRTTNDLPRFRVGQRLVVFGFFNDFTKEWAVLGHGVFEVQPDRVVALSRNTEVAQYASVDALLSALRRAADEP